MIPRNDALQGEIRVEEPATRTFYLDAGRNVVFGHVDKLEAMRQAIYLILGTERYRYPIFTWNYGVELGGLFGRAKSYALPELKRRISEALMQDTRVERVEGFTFRSRGNVVTASFVVVTDYGDIEAERAVEL